LLECLHSEDIALMAITKRFTVACALSDLSYHLSQGLCAYLACQPDALQSIVEDACFPKG
jgi:hypothetical protein